MQPCSGKPLTDPLDLSTYTASIFGDFQGVVQYNLEHEGVMVSDICEVMTAPSGCVNVLPQLEYRQVFLSQQTVKKFT